MMAEVVEKVQRVEVSYCPRCHHDVRFCQAHSDHAWVCQKCLRYRVYQAQLTGERDAAHPAKPLASSRSARG